MEVPAPPPPRSGPPHPAFVAVIVWVVAVEALAGWIAYMFWNMARRFGMPVLATSAVKWGTWMVGLAIAGWLIASLWRTRRLGAFLVVVCAARLVVGRAAGWMAMTSAGAALERAILGPMLLAGVVAAVGWGLCIWSVLWRPGERELQLDGTVRGRILIRAGAIGVVWGLAEGAAAPLLAAVLTTVL